MKRIYLLLNLLLCVVVVNAQVFRLSYKDRETGDSLVFSDVCHVILDPDEGLNATFIYIENLTDNDINYKIELSEINMCDDEAEVLMCFDNTCLETLISPVKTISAGDVVRNFDLNYKYNSLNNSSLKVKFLKADDNSLLQSFDVTYSESLDALASPKVAAEKSIPLSLSASPLPASSYTNISYSIPAQYNKADIVIRNPLGAVTAKYRVQTGKVGKLTLDVSDFNSGIYFYSIIADGKTLSTKKLIIKH
ncbi:MAG: T9SS type A sorting domain-containing protein [Bacteroidales bacterium]|nr:T9SS type A sorting domain-containing protein [Bacteroidales bacterium]